MMTLQCTVHVSPSDSDPITWSWTCGDKDLTSSSTSSGDTSTMTFKADRKFNKKLCYCRATSNSSVQTYNSTSTYRSIQVYYPPLTTPTLNAYQIEKSAGEDITLQCSIDSLGNPPIRWSWKCGTRTIYSRITNINLTSKVVFTAEQGLNGKSCYCEVEGSSRSYEFKASSSAADVSVLYFPSDYPQISTRTINVNEGSPVILRCSLSSAGNPPVTWSWYCNDVMMREGVRNRDTSTELSFIAKLTDDKAFCYCRGKSSHTLIKRSYDQKSSSCYIKIIDPTHTVTVLSKESRSEGISPAAFGATLTILLIALFFCTIIIVIQHRRIPKESSLITWVLVKLGRVSDRKRKSKSFPEEIPEEHSYETLKTGYQIKNKDETFSVVAALEYDSRSLIRWFSSNKMQEANPEKFPAISIVLYVSDQHNPSDYRHLTVLLNVFVGFGQWRWVPFYICALVCLLPKTTTAISSSKHIIMDIDNAIHRLNYGTIFKSMGNIHISKEFWLQTYKIPIPAQIPSPKGFSKLKVLATKVRLSFNKNRNDAPHILQLNFRFLNMMLQYFLFVLLSGIISGTSIVNTIAAPWLQMSANNVTEGQPITLKCTVHSSPNSTSVTWSWICGNDNLTRNATSTLQESVLKISSDRKYNGEACYCKVWPRSANETYSKMSNHKTINVKYAPREVPFLNASKTVVSAGEEITLMCTLDSLGNPPIRWSWKCDRIYLYNRRIYNLNATSKLVLEADENLNGKVCYCMAKSYPLNYEASSNTVSLTVYSFPDGNPEIDKSIYFVDENTPVKLSCSLRSAGNPPVSWLWYCDNKLQDRGIKHSGSRSALTIFAQRKDHNIACYCRAKSQSQWGNYDRNSSKAIIAIKSISNSMSTSSKASAGISAGVFGAVTGIFLLVLILAGVIIFIHHRRIDDIGKQYSTGTRENVKDTGGGQDNLNYRTLREEGAHSKD
ncbi:uncharacterized protein LOC133192412 [Saccostrea echinata]|uniref:uncharacterized protein LOC133192412 n=1 Tax=Saccostrea echinata TaxID=191078 RepID=UPI002A805C1F|nr:uncharacterized protein LOC133192412 [Saccostrea echinata]